jgi:hypothetical protein
MFYPKNPKLPSYFENSAQYKAPAYAPTAGMSPDQLASVMYDPAAHSWDRTNAQIALNNQQATQQFRKPVTLAPLTGGAYQSLVPGSARTLPQTTTTFDQSAYARSVGQEALGSRFIAPAAPASAVGVGPRNPTDMSAVFQSRSAASAKQRRSNSLTKAAENLVGSVLSRFGVSPAVSANRGLQNAYYSGQPGHAYSQFLEPDASGEYWGSKGIFPDPQSFAPTGPATFDAQPLVPGYRRNSYLLGLRGHPVGNKARRPYNIA